jgi:small nuclear ribonucleoprotein (snRNP)-like protein
MVEVQVSEVRGFRGTLVGFDKHLNIVVMDAEEMRLIDGEPRFEARGLIVLRGIYVQSVGSGADPPPGTPAGRSAWQPGVGAVDPFARGST